MLASGVIRSPRHGVMVVAQPRAAFQR